MAMATMALGLTFGVHADLPLNNFVAGSLSSGAKQVSTSSPLHRPSYAGIRGEPGHLVAAYHPTAPNEPNDSEPAGDPSAVALLVLGVMPLLHLRRMISRA